MHAVQSPCHHQTFRYVYTVLQSRYIDIRLLIGIWKWHHIPENVHVLNMVVVSVICTSY